MSKGSRRRPRQISVEEEELRWAYACSNISLKEYKEKLAQFQRGGRITRSGRIVK